jgi:hypothetical protein
MPVKPKTVPLHNLDLKEVYHRTGSHTGGDTYVAERLLTGPFPEGAEEFALVLSWPGEWAFFRVEVVKNDRGPKDASRFSDRLDVAREVLAGYGIAPDRLGRDYEVIRGKSKKRFLLGEVRRETPLAVTVVVDTDSPEFIALAANAAHRTSAGVALEVQLITYPKPPQGARCDPEQRTLTVNLMPAQVMPRLEGFVALDLGNTNSTLVLMEKDTDEVHDIKVVNVEGGDAGAPVETAVELVAYPRRKAPGGYGPIDPEQQEREAEQARAYPTPEWTIGAMAKLETNGWLILGAKRNLADPEAAPLHPSLEPPRRGAPPAAPTGREDNGFLPVNIEGHKHYISKRLPAELFITAVLKQLCQQERRYPGQLAITHPSTYSSREAEVLRETVYHAWRRAMGGDAYKLDREKLEKLIPVVLDEASAAAIYFLYRDFAQAPGGLKVFRYLYPRGMDMLLYDCGGGTTDVALVHAGMRPGDGGKRVLGVEVLGRTGVRDFGGDDITAAVFKIVKGQLGAQLSGAVSGQPRLTYPKNSPQDLPAWLKTNRAALDRLVPTRFNPRHLDEASRGPMRAAKDLWFWAETIKKKLGVESPYKNDPRNVFWDPNMVLVQLLGSKFPALKGEQLHNFFKNVEVHREEVDELIRPQVHKSIDNTNRMIAERLAPDSEVNWVYVVGNASLYPLVREAIQERLHVRFLKEDAKANGEDRAKDVRGRMRFDKDDLKNPVAKGAVLALGLYSKVGGMGLDFDNTLKDRLPFHVLFRDLGAGGYRTLFREHEHYDQLGEKVIPVPPAEEDERGEQRDRRTDVFLRRQWPGDDRPSRFLHFQFDRPVDGPLMVSYQRDPPRFLMRDEGRSGQQVEGKERVEAVYCSLMQQGEL